MRESTTPRREATRTVIAVIAALLTGCSGGGGGDNTPAPTVQLQAEPSEVASGGTTTLTWSSTNADSCQASGGWSGTKLVSGSEATGPVTMTTTFTLQCTGHGGTASASATVTLLGATGTVAGNLLVPTISRSDSDVNDPFAPFAPNDNDLQAQVMPNPVVIGGYVNVPGAGPDPASRSPIGDPEDWYRMDLVAGQVIELVIPSAIRRRRRRRSASLRLGPRDSRLHRTVPARSSRSLSPQPGHISSGVLAFDGAPLYRLSVGQATAASGGSSLSLSDDFVPGEVIVTLKSAGDPAAKTATSDAVLATRYKTSRKGGDPGRAMLLKLPTDAAKIAAGMTPSSRATTATSKASAATSGGAASAATPRWRVASAAQQRKLDTLLYAKLLRRDPDVRSADLNRVMRVSRRAERHTRLRDPALALRADPAPQRLGPDDGQRDPRSPSSTPASSAHPELASKLDRWPRPHQQPDEPGRRRHRRESRRSRLRDRRQLDLPRHARGRHDRRAQQRRDRRRGCVLGRADHAGARARRLHGQRQQLRHHPGHPLRGWV